MRRKMERRQEDITMDELIWCFNLPCCELIERTFERKVLSSISHFFHQNKEMGEFYSMRTNKQTQHF